ncbi:MAG: gluconate 2-dehydrogenase subunit 3 family protein, partial [Acidobacteriaceae bacterium]|nr:gluconate 2-dehydrogenase subunit 3 family protein [Acidobacteriaceae bacterium]
KTDFFETVRIHTVLGFLSNPEHGGNHDKLGWKLIGFEDTFVYEPPFGYYDAERGSNRG